MFSHFRSSARRIRLPKSYDLTLRTSLTNTRSPAYSNMSGKTRPASDMDKPILPPVEKKPRVGGPTARLEDGAPEIAVAANETAVGMSKNAAKKDARKKGRKQRHKLPELGTSEDVVYRDVAALLGQNVVDEAIESGTEWETPFAFLEEVELTVSALSSSGEALAVAPSSKRPWVVVVPFSLPGEEIRARVYRNSRLHSFADLISVDTPNPEMRDMSLVKCRYFGKCAGCQYQMLSYDTQLKLKRHVVVKAYQNYSDLPESDLPVIESTIGSPLQYGYRTKITPHFDAPPKKLQKKGPEAGEGKPDWLKIGFNEIGKRHVMDIEECPIATPVLNEAYTPLRTGIEQKIYSYKKGVSLLLRDSLEIPPNDAADPVAALSSDFEKHICVTDHKKTVRERVGDKLFDYQAGSFFQNNNSVLVPLTSYVRDAIFPPSSPLSAAEKPTHLVDAYCGAGLFALTLAPHFATAVGIELSADSIRFAAHNAALNGFAPERVSFRAGDAADIFGAVTEFPAARTVLVIDPPRKGCDERFLRQLLAFRARTVVYVSCNVHTQARDIGMVLRESAKEEGRGRYVLRSLRGFDLFPQTAHVESVAVMELVDGS